MAAQWIAWRIRIPAIALLLVAGFLIGPVFGYINPAQDLGAVYKPIIALSVAIILFEGGLTLNFKEIRETSRAVRAIILVGGPLVWFMSALAAHYAAGLSWPSAIVLGAILVVTGPTVIMPLLRQAQLGSRTASLLRWEAIINDPIGALFAVIAFETYLVLHGNHGAGGLVFTLIIGAATALIGGFAAGRFVGAAFVRGYVPEYLKAPILLVSVLVVYAVSDVILKESGLLTVTIMGVTMANQRMASLAELRRFKETVTVLLVSGLFVLLTASLDLNALISLGWGAAIFVGLCLFVIRPIAIMLATTGSGLTLNERVLVSWIAPRGIVAVAVSGLFGAELAEMGVEDGTRLTALTFAVVASTILLHGFTLSPLASLLRLKSARKPGILIVGGSEWSNALAAKLVEIDLPVLIADSNWNHIRRSRLSNIPVFFGEVLSEAAHHDITLNRYGHVIAATDNDAYNALVCTEFGPEIGRGNVYQIGDFSDDNHRQSLNFTLGGRDLFEQGLDFSELRRQMWNGWVFQATKLTDEFGFDAYQQSRDEKTQVLFWVKPNGTTVFRQNKKGQSPETGDTLIAFGPPPANTKSAKSSTPKSSKDSTSS